MYSTTCYTLFTRNLAESALSRIAQESRNLGTTPIFDYNLECSRIHSVPLNSRQPLSKLPNLSLIEYFRALFAV